MVVMEAFGRASSLWLLPFLGLTAAAPHPSSHRSCPLQPPEFLPSAWNFQSRDMTPPQAVDISCQLHQAVRIPGTPASFAHGVRF